MQMQPLDRMAVILGEFGVPDHGKPRTPANQNPATGSNSNPADSAVHDNPADRDFSSIADVDVTFLQDLAEYLRGLEVQGATVSWFWWAWNANSGRNFWTLSVCTLGFVHVFLCIRCHCCLTHASLQPA
jgi:hypothetical protein